MNHRTGVVPAVALAVLMLFPPADRPSRARAAAVPPEPVGRMPETPAVQLEHQLIRVPEVRSPRAVPAPRRAPPATRLARLHADRHAPLARARRMLVGDGRYRPEPFPRLMR